MSYNTLISTIKNSVDNTILRDVYFAHHYSKIEDKEKNEFPFMWVAIDSNQSSINTNESLVDNWSFRCMVFHNDSTGRSKGSLTKEEIQKLDDEIYDIISQFQYNLYQMDEVDGITMSSSTSVPIYNDGAVVWSVDTTMQIMNRSKYCREC